MRFLFSLGVFVLLLQGCVSNDNIQWDVPEPLELTAQDFLKGFDSNPGSLLVDVRTKEEFAQGALERADNVPWMTPAFDQYFSCPPKTKPLYIYCASGFRSGFAAHDLTKRGFIKVFTLQGGLDSLKETNPELIKKKP